MPFYIDLRFSGAALLLVILFGPVVAFVVRRRWRLMTARQEEVRRLAYLAAQEAALAEMEAMAAYSVTSSVGAYSYPASVANELATLPECAVCSIPANARCARCKAVRYWGENLRMRLLNKGCRESVGRREFTNEEKSPLYFE